MFVPNMARLTNAVVVAMEVSRELLHIRIISTLVLKEYSSFAFVSPRPNMNLTGPKTD